MKSADIYAQLESHHISVTHFFGRKLYIVSYADFEKYRDSFSVTKNIFSSKRNFRTADFFKHIHAVQTGSFVEFHWDFGNLYRSPFMAIPHLLFDVIPYFLWHLLTGKKPYAIEVP